MLERVKHASVAELLKQWQWKPLQNCPGRFVLVSDDPRTSLETLLGGNCHVQSFTSQAANDTVLVVSLEDGGLISYARQDGTFRHTLNTAEGFAPKLSQLGIRL